MIAGLDHRADGVDGDVEPARNLAIGAFELTRARAQAQPRAHRAPRRDAWLQRQSRFPRTSSPSSRSPNSARLIGFSVSKRRRDRTVKALRNTRSTKADPDSPKLFERASIAAPLRRNSI